MRIGRVGLPTLLWFVGLPTLIWFVSLPKEFGLSVCQSYFGKPSPQGLFQRLTFERSNEMGEGLPITFGESTFI
jgi:hypothetical protein